jgi:hypothetical protein
MYRSSELRSFGPYLRHKIDVRCKQDKLDLEGCSLIMHKAAWHALCPWQSGHHAAASQRKTAPEMAESCKGAMRGSLHQETKSALGNGMLLMPANAHDARTVRDEGQRHS